MENINIGLTPNDGTGDNLRTAFDKTVKNFDELSLVKSDLTGATFTGNISATNLSGTNSGDETKSSIEAKLGTASSSNNGYLSSTDWTTFNNKAEVSQTITNGVTTSSPSEDAVFDALSLKLNSEPFQLSVATTSNFSTSDTISGYSMYGKNIVVNNGITNININVSSYDGFICSFLKNSNANITFTQGIGRTLVLSSNTNTLTGTLGSTAVISSDGTTDFLKIDNR